MRGLAKSFGTRQVLRGVDLTLTPGEFVAILGPSGGGKTTVLKIVAGLDSPTAGLVAVRSVTGREPMIRVVYQEDRLLPWRSVLDNAALGLPASERERAVELLDAVGLAGREHDWPVVLSGGQKQRTALARALVHQPDLLLLDEPFGALDALTRASMQQLLLDLWNRERCTVLLVTHDVEEALLLADRVVVLQDGHLTRDLRVALPRPRHRGDPQLGAWEEELMDSLLQSERSGVTG
jgi:sulfonate transport system ATP-binding protein